MCLWHIAHANVDWTGQVQVKEKMTCAQFLKNNKGINDGQDFPKEFLEELYRNIERRAIRIPPAHQADGLQRNSLPELIRYIPIPLDVEMSMLY